MEIRANIKYLLCIAIILIVIANPVWASLYDIEVDSLFGLCIDSTGINAVDTFALKQMSKAKIRELGPKYSNIPYICKKYSFANLPYIELYDVDCVESSLVGGPYSAFLFNTCDSSICQFNGDADKFSMVLKNNLSSIIAQQQAKDLINLYLNILAYDEPYRIIDSLDSYIRIWDKESIPRTYYYSDVVDDINILRDLNPRTELSFKDNAIDAIIWTWNKMTGIIEKWHFEISRAHFRLLGKTVAADKMGPYMNEFHR